MGHPGQVKDFYDARVAYGGKSIDDPCRWRDEPRG
jgi:hypothetical protein